MGRELETQKTASVFDFLYADHHRIGLFLSQFSDFGNLTDIVHERGTSGDNTTSLGFKGVVGGEWKGGDSASVQRRFDPQWSQALNFLDEVNARGMLNRDLGQTGLGSLVIVNGSLSILNMKPLERAWNAVLENAKEQNQGAQVRRKDEKLRSRPAAKPVQHAVVEEDLAGLRILGAIDQPIMMALSSGQHRVWSTLEPNYLIGGSSDLTLKHGVRINGDWHVVGILDCFPGAQQTDAEEIGRICGGGENIFSSGAMTIWRELGQIFGRPSECHGVTPIMIMREIKPRAVGQAGI